MIVPIHTNLNLFPVSNSGCPGVEGRQTLVCGHLTKYVPSVTKAGALCTPQRFVHRYDAIRRPVLQLSDRDPPWKRVGPTFSQSSEACHSDQYYSVVELINLKAAH